MCLFLRWVYSGVGSAGRLSNRVEGNSSGLSMYVNNLELSATRPKMFLSEDSLSNLIVTVF